MGLVLENRWREDVVGVDGDMVRIDVNLKVMGCYRNTAAVK